MLSPSPSLALSLLLFFLPPLLLVFLINLPFGSGSFALGAFFRRRWSEKCVRAFSAKKEILSLLTSLYFSMREEERRGTSKAGRRVVKWRGGGN